MLVSRVEKISRMVNGKMVKGERKIYKVVKDEPKVPKAKAKTKAEK